LSALLTVYAAVYRSN